MSTSNPRLARVKVAIFCCRLSLIVSLGVAIWMTVCKGEFTVSRLVKEQGVKMIDSELRDALGGCADPGIPVQVADTLRKVSLLLPTEADRENCRLGLRRDYLFIGAYTLAYLCLALLLSWRADWVPGLRISFAGFLLALVTAGCDVGENIGTRCVVDRLHGDYGTGGVRENRETVTREQEGAASGDVKLKQRYSYAKWYANFALWMVFAFVWLRRRRLWQMLSGGLLFIGGLWGVIAGGVSPVHIQGAFIIASLGLLIGTVLLFCIRSPRELWEQVSE